MAERRGKKTNHTKNNVARLEWMTGKKIGRRKQEWVNEGTSAFELSPGIVSFTQGYWKKV
jgi:hypothetical protein